MDEKIGSDVLKGSKPEGLQFHGNPWQRRADYRNAILELLFSNTEKSWTASEIAREANCTTQTAQIILLELALEGLVQVEPTKQGYSKLYRLRSEVVGKRFVKQYKPKLSFDYSEEGEETSDQSIPEPTEKGVEEQ